MNKIVTEQLQTHHYINYVTNQHVILYTRKISPLAHMYSMFLYISFPGHFSCSSQESSEYLKKKTSVNSNRNLKLQNIVCKKKKITQTTYVINIYITKEMLNDYPFGIYKHFIAQSMLMFDVSHPCCPKCSLSPLKGQSLWLGDSIGIYHLLTNVPFQVSTTLHGQQTLRFSRAKTIFIPFLTFPY